jgi:chromosome segregation ATPase
MLKALRDGDLTEKFKIINIALNAVHQTGDMIDYVEGEHNEISKQLLTDLSNMNVDKLNSKLKMQGFQVDKTKKWEPFTESTADDVKLKSVENQIGNKQKDIDNKTTQKDRLNNDIQNMEKRGIKTPSDANRMERLKKQISDLDKRIKANVDQMNKIYNTYTKSKTSMAPILGKTLGTIDDISKQKDEEKDFFKDDVNYKNRQLGFNFSTGGSNLDRIEKSISYEKESIESKIREFEKRNKELSEEISKLEKEMEKAKKEISRIGDPNDIKHHSNDDYNERNRTIRIENLRKYNHIVRNNPDKIKRNVDEISKNTKEISKLKSDLIKNFPEN